MNELYPGVYVLTTTPAPTYKGSKAEEYIARHTNKRYENFKLAMKQAELNAANAQDAFERKQKLSQSIIDGLDDQIKQTQKLSYDLQKGIISAEEAADRWRAGQARTDARAQASLIGQSIGRQVTVMKAKGTAVKALDLTTDDQAAEQIAKASSLDEAITKGAKVYGQTGANSDEFAARYAADTMQAMPGDPIALKGLNRELASRGLVSDERGNVTLLNDKETTYSAGEISQKAGEVPTISGGGNYKARSGDREQLIRQMQADIDALSVSRNAKEQAALSMEAPVIDLIGDARKTYDQNFERNPYWEQERQKEAAKTETKIQMLNNFVRGYVNEEQMMLDKNQLSSPDEVKAATARGVARAMTSLRRISPSTTRAVEPVISAPIPTVYLIDKDWKYLAEPGVHPYVYRKETDGRYTIINGPNPNDFGKSVGPASTGKDKIAFDSIIKNAIPATPEFKAWKAEQNAPEMKPPRLEPIIDYDPGSAVPTVAPTLNSDTGLKGSPHGFNPPVASKSKPVEPPKMDKDQQDKAGRLLSGLVGTALAEKPKKVERLKTNTTYGPIITGIVTSMQNELSDPSRSQQARQTITDTVIKQFQNPTEQSRALELTHALLALHDDSKRAKMDPSLRA